MENMPQIENIIIDNIFSQEQIEYIYGVIKSTPEDKGTVQTRLGHRAWFAQFDESLRLHLQKIVQDRFGSDWYLNEFQFARYSNEYGYQPKLYPHYDDAFKCHKLTLDIQIESNTVWPIVVEGKSFTLEDNQGLIFSGTDQIHWREDKVLEDGEFLDMFFCHLQKDVEVSDEWKQHMIEKEKYWNDIVGISREAVELDK
jgi:hypothetical protein